MSNLGNEPAYPAERDDGYGHVTKFCTGLTKREAFAMAMLQGLLSNPGGPVQASPRSGWLSAVNCCRGQVAQEAVYYADALLEELAKDGAA